MLLHEISAAETDDGSRFRSASGNAAMLSTSCQLVLLDLDHHHQQVKQQQQWPWMQP